MEEKDTIQQAVEELKTANEDDLKATIERWFESTRTQGLKIGAQFISAATFGIIQKHTKKKTKPSLRDYERMTAEIIKLVSVQLNNNEETQQNDSEEVEDDGATE